jgi:predicted MFS family arabinose efflux permease
LLFLMIYLIAISIFSELEEFDQLYYHLAKLPLYAFGLVGFTFSALNAVSAFFSYKMKNIRAIFYLLPFICGILLIFVAKYPSLPVIGLLLLAYILSTPVRVLVESRIQHNIASESRATITSAGTLLINLFGVLLAPLWGLISEIWNLQSIYAATAIFLFLLVIWAFINHKKLNRTDAS